MSIRDGLVYGERVGDLLPGLRAFVDAGCWGDDGMFHSSVRLDPEIGDPMCRALMRVRAELLLEDADAIGSPWDERRIDPHAGPTRSFASSEPSETRSSGTGAALAGH